MRDLEIRGAGELLGAEQSGPRRRGRLRALRRAPERGGRRALRPAPRRRAAGPRGRARRRVRAGCLHRLRGAEDRPAPPARAHARTRTSCASCAPSVEDRYGELPEPVENLFAIQEAKLKLARVGADYLVFRGGRMTVGPLVLGSGELRSSATAPRPPSTPRQAGGRAAPGRLPRGARAGGRDARGRQAA